MDAKIDFVKELTVLELKEDDIIIIKVDSTMSDKQHSLLAKQFKRAIPERLKDKIKLVVTENIDVGILRTKLN